ncbi:MAG: hypothetical protein KAG61_12815 [Bacteriovoracaceae bacterium]|nr:hypothetical protein [Bacteriovoracaceae bacterium]
MSESKLGYTIHRYRKLLLTILILSMTYTIYRIYRVEIYLWSCENEQISSSCTIVGILSLEQGKKEVGHYYLSQACDMKYGLACKHLADNYAKDGVRDKAQTFYKKACDYNFGPACEFKQ